MNRKNSVRDGRFEELLKLIQDALEDRKAKDIRVLDVEHRSDFADYFIIATGTSARHVSSIADYVYEKVKHSGTQPAGIEGAKTSDWILIDLQAVVIHVMRSETRAFYNLEELWTDIQVGPKGPQEDSVLG